MGTDYVNYWGSAWDSSWEWTLKFAWLPCKMDTGEYVWLKDYFQGVRIVTGPGTPVILKQYITPQEYLFKAIKES
jgi:hypothetical protein